LLVHELILTGTGNKIAIYEKSAVYSYDQMQQKVSTYRNYLYSLGLRRYALVFG